MTRRDQKGCCLEEGAYYVPKRSRTLLHGRSNTRTKVGSYRHKDSGGGNEKKETEKQGQKQGRREKKEKRKSYLRWWWYVTWVPVSAAKPTREPCHTLRGLFFSLLLIRVMCFFLDLGLLLVSIYIRIYLIFFFTWWCGYEWVNTFVSTPPTHHTVFLCWRTSRNTEMLVVVLRPTSAHTNQRAQQITYASFHTYPPIPTQPPFNISALVHIALKRLRPLDYCWSKNRTDNGK